MEEFEVRIEKSIVGELNDEKVVVDVEDDQNNDEEVILLTHSGSIHASNSGIFSSDAHLLGITNSKDDGVDHTHGQIKLVLTLENVTTSPYIT
jgi:hypothetical protein